MTRFSHTTRYIFSSPRKCLTSDILIHFDLHSSYHREFIIIMRQSVSNDFMIFSKLVSWSFIISLATGILLSLSFNSNLLWSSCVVRFYFETPKSPKSEIIRRNSSLNIFSAVLSKIINYFLSLSTFFYITARINHARNLQLSPCGNPNMPANSKIVTKDLITVFMIYFWYSFFLFT